MRRITSSRTLVVLGVALIAISTSACSSQNDQDSGMGPDGEPPAAAGSESMSDVDAGSGNQEEGGSFQDLAAQQQAAAEARKVQAEAAAARGRILTEQGRLEEALDAFATALRIDPSNADAQSGYQQVSSLLGRSGGALVGEAQESLQQGIARMQQAEVLARNAQDRGRRLYSEGRYDEAVQAFEQALTIRKVAGVVVGDFDEAGVRQAIADARGKADQARRDAEAERLREIERINSEKEDEERRASETRLARMLREAEDQFSREKFDACIATCQRIVDEDPTSEEARKLLAIAKRVRLAKNQAATQESYRKYWVRALDEVKELARPQTSTVEFSSLRQWERISQRGPISLSKDVVTVSEVDAEVRRALEDTILPSVDWTDKTLDEAMAFVAANTRTNIVVMRAVEEVVPEEERILSIELTETRAANAISLAVESFEGLAWVIDDGQVKITTVEMARKKKVLEYYEVRDLTAAIQNFPGIDFNLNPSGVGGGLAGFEDDFGGDEEENFSLFDADRLMQLIRDTVDRQSWDDDAENTIDNKNGTLVVKQTPENQRKIGQLLADLRASLGMQVKIEARFISVENNFLQDIGVDIRGLGDDTGGVGVPGAGTATPFDDFGFPGSTTAAVLGTDNSAGATYSIGGGNGQIAGRTQNLFDVQLGDDEVLTGSGGFALQYTYLDDSQLEAILRAVQKYERVNLVTAPNLMVSNTQRGNLQVSNQVTYIKDFDVEIAQAAVIADPIVDVVREGVTLDVRPIVSNDRRFITLELRPTVATLVRPLRTFTSSLGTGTAVTIEMPELRKESLKTTVVMPDGGTLLLGGLKFYEEEDIESGIPILKDIPFIGFLFSRDGKYSNIRDLIVLLRAEIVIMEELEPGR